MTTKEYLINAVAEVDAIIEQCTDGITLENLRKFRHKLEIQLKAGC